MRLKTTLFALLVVSLNAVFAQTGTIWTSIPNTVIPQDVFLKNYKPASFTSYQLDLQEFKKTVANAPMQGTIDISTSPSVITIPVSNGILETFRIVESPVMEQGLADKFPMIKTYLGTGITHPGSTIRFDISPKGFNATILSANRQPIYINAVDELNSYHIVFDRSELSADSSAFECKTAAATPDQTKKAARGADDGEL